MNKLKTYVFSPLFLFLFFACTDGSDSQQEKKDASPLGGGNDHQTVVIKGVFKTKSSECRSGFGWCKIQFTAPDSQTKSLDSLESKGTDNYSALLRLNEKDTTLQLEFMEQVPHFGEEFLVDSSETFTNVLGYSWLQIVPGNYKPLKDLGTFGGVNIHIKKGNPL